MPPFWKLWISGCLLALFFAFEALSVPRKPNILFVVLDDLDNTLSAPYFDEVMPFLTRETARNGIRFTGAHSAAICCEARAALLTGLYAHNNGVFTNGGLWGGYAAFRAPRDASGAPLRNAGGQLIDNEERTIARYLQDQGYETGFFGKYLNGFEQRDGLEPPIPLFWNQGALFVDPLLTSYTGYNYDLISWRGTASQLLSYGRKPADYSTDVLSQLTLQFIRQSKAPSFVYLSYTAPHFPLPPAPRHQLRAQRYRGHFPHGAGNSFADGAFGFTDKPTWLQDSLSQRLHPSLRTWVEFEWPKRLGSLLAVDEGLEALWSELQASGEADDTIVFVTSDNGYNQGAHGLIHKMAPYEETLRVPLFVFAGRNIPLARGQRSDAWVAHVDYLPTFLDLAGVSIPDEVDGLSFAPLLGSPAEPHRSQLFFSYQTGFAANGIQLPASWDFEGSKWFLGLQGFIADVPTHLGVKERWSSSEGDASFKLILWPRTDRGLFTAEAWSEAEWELYDLDRDPLELRNLLYDRAEPCRELFQRMVQSLQDAYQCKGEVCRVTSKKEADAAIRSCRGT